MIRATPSHGPIPSRWSRSMRRVSRRRERLPSGDGSFAFDLQPGGYTLHAERTSAMFPSIADANVVVAASATRATPQRVIVTGDTGIR